MEQKVVIILVIVGIFICCISAVIVAGGVYYYKKKEDEDDEDIIGGSGTGSGSRPGSSSSSSSTTTAAPLSPVLKQTVDQAVEKKVQEAVQQVQESRPKPQGVMFKISGSGKCLQANSATGGSELKFHDCDPYQTLQRFNASMSRGQTGTIKLSGTNLCINNEERSWKVQGATVAPLKLRDCNNSEDRRFKRESWGDLFQSSNSPGTYLHSHYDVLKRVHWNNGDAKQWKEFSLIN